MRRRQNEDEMIYAFLSFSGRRVNFSTKPRDDDETTRKKMTRKDETTRLTRQRNDCDLIFVYFCASEKLKNKEKLKTTRKKTTMMRLTGLTRLTRRRVYAFSF